MAVVGTWIQAANTLWNYLGLCFYSCFNCPLSMGCLASRVKSVRSCFVYTFYFLTIHGFCVEKSAWKCNITDDAIFQKLTTLFILLKLLVLDILSVYLSLRTVNLYKLSAHFIVQLYLYLFKFYPKCLFDILKKGWSTFSKDKVIHLLCSVLPTRAYKWIFMKAFTSSFIFWYKPTS